MPRRKISEYRAKQIIALALGIEYEGYTEETFHKVAAAKTTTYVVKVDQAVKGRFKKGLVKLDIAKKDVPGSIIELQKKGYNHVIIEPYHVHDQADERYLSMTRDASGLQLSVSANGGVDIESNAETIRTYRIDESTDWKETARQSGLTADQLQALVAAFRDNYFTFLEINPYVLDKGKLQLLDLAVEVDDAAQYLVDSWGSDDMRMPPRVLSDEEETVAKLGEKSPASFSFQMINPDGALFVLLSGGGASVTVCDEIYSAGYGKQLANYGEYSGNPTQEEAYIYTSALLQSLLKSKAKKKALFIGGAVANFTDIAKTFAGVTKAIDEFGERLKKQHVHVVVRRGGPNQVVGLQNIRQVLEEYGLTAAVYDQTTTIDAAVGRVLEEIA